MSKKVSLQIRIEEDLRNEVDFILKSMGISMADAVRMFLAQIANDKAMPFKPSSEYVENDNCDN